MQLADHTEGEFFALLVRKGSEWAGMLAVQRDRDSQVLYGPDGSW